MKSTWLFVNFISLILLISGCLSKNNEPNDVSKNFTSELSQLKTLFKIPGLAVSIEQGGEIIYSKCFGFSDLENKTKVDSSTLFPIASITKVFSGVLIMKLVEQGEISLNESVKKYLPNSSLNDSILIKHIVSHTSQGNSLGKNFYYSSRFTILTDIIEHVSDLSFKEFLDKEILNPLKLKNTFLLRDSFQIVNEKYDIAQPYNLDNGIERGHLDFGYSASAGIVSTIKDLRIFNSALDNNTLITNESKQIMFTPIHPNLPYAKGIFTQSFSNSKLIWAYGQYDSYSSLYLKIPSEDITLTLLANNNLMSDPARLIYGDITSSLFALSFLKNYILNFDGMKILEPSDSLNFKSYPTNTFYRKKILSQALAESFMARFDNKHFHASANLLDKIFHEHTNYLEYADLNLLHNLIFLKD